MSIKSLLKLNKDFKNIFRELRSYLYTNLTEFDQISLKILPNLTDFSSQLMACMPICPNTVEFQWLEHPWDYENMLETGVVRASEY